MMRCPLLYDKFRVLRPKLVAAILVLGFFVLFGSGFVEQGWCAETVQPPASKPLAFRRVFVPADTPEAWPIGSGRYLPVRAKEFQQLLEQAGVKELSSDTTKARLAGVVYRAELQDDGTLVGSAHQQVELTGNQPRLLSLQPMGAVITSAQWQRSPSEQALLGTWNRGPTAGQELAVLVEHSDTFILAWQQAPRTAVASRYEYLLAFPPAVPAQFVLTLPPDHTPVVAHGTITEPQLLDNGDRRWTLQLGPTLSNQLTIQRNSDRQENNSLPRASQSTAYRLDSTGLEFETTVVLDARATVAESLRFSLTGSARITGASVDGKSSDWQRTERTEGEFIIPLGSRSSGRHEITVRAVAPLQTDQPWQLPTLHLQSVFWTSGTSGLTVSPALDLRSLHPQDAILKHIVGITDDHPSGEAYRIEQWSETSSLEIVVQRQPPRVRSRLIHILDLGRDETTGRTVAMLANVGQPTFQIEAAVTPNWTIESVETDPPSALGNWRIVHSGDSSGSEESGNAAVVKILLNRPLQRGKPVQLRIDGRWIAPGPFFPTTLDRLPLVQFRDAVTERQLLSMRTTDRGQIHLPEELASSRIEIAELAPDEAKLLASQGESQVLDITDLAVGTVVEASHQQARYEADAYAKLIVAGESFQHQFQFDVRPTMGAVASVVVEFQTPLPDSVKWGFTGEERSIAVERIATTVGPESEGESSTSYRVRLPVAQEEPFQLTAQFTIEGESSARCIPLAMPEATDWQGWIQLVGPLDGVRVDDNDCLPVGPNGNFESLAEGVPLLGRYRMDSSLPLQSQAAPTVYRKVLLHKQETDRGVAWLADYTTILESDGSRVHVASYCLENRGVNQAEIMLPENAKLQMAWQDRARVEPRSVAGVDGAYRFHISDQNRTPSITVRYTSDGAPLGSQIRLGPSVPTCSFAVMRGRWTVWTSQQHAVKEISAAGTSETLPWFTRLFGPLVRDSSKGVFRPFSVRHWQELWSTPLENLHSRHSAEQLEASLASRLVTNPLQSWSSTLLEVVDELQIRETVLVDQAALSSQGIEAGTPVGKFVTESNGAWEGNSSPIPLPSSGVALVASPAAITVTTTDRVAQWQDQLHRKGDSGIYSTESGWLASRLKRPGKISSSEIVSVAAWAEVSNIRRTSWNLPAAPSLAAVGWKAHTFQFVDSSPTVVVHHVSSRHAMWYAVWLLATVLGACWIGPRPGWLAIAAALSAALCLVVDPSSVALPQAVFLGALTAIGLRTVWQIRAKAHVNRDQSNHITRSFRTAAKLVVLAALIVLSEGHARAEEGKSIESGTYRQVLYPIDSLGHSQGDDVFVSEGFLAELNNRHRSSAFDGADAVLLQAHYQGTLPDSLHTEPIDAERWTISLVAKSFVPGCRWRLPFHRNEATWFDEDHRLDGAPLQLKWNTNGEGCEVLLSEPGTHRLELRLTPRIDVTNQLAQLSLHIPPVRGATLDLTTPTDVDQLRVAAAGLLKTADQQQRIHTRLSATDRLLIEWAASSGFESEPLSGSVEQSSWLHVDPSGVLLDVRFQIHSEADSPRSLLLEKPPYLKLLLPMEGSPVESFQPISKSPTSVLLKLKPALGKQFDLSLQFQLERSTAVGEIAYPQVRLAGVEPTRNWFAVSVSPGLKSVAEDSTEFRPIAAKEFALQWQPSEAEPQFAYSVEDRSRDWVLSVWPDSAALSAKQSIRVEAYREGIRVEYEALVDETTGSWLIHRLRIPRTLRVKGVSVTEQSTEAEDVVPTRWIRHGEEELVIFSGRPVTESHTIRLQGTMEASARGRVPLPTISLLDAKRGEVRLDLYRQPDVLVAWKNQRHKLQETKSEQLIRQSADLLVGRYLWRMENTTGREMLRITRNRPRLNADTITTIDQDASGYTATFAVHLSVRQGVVDRIRVAAPLSWQDSWEVLPAGRGLIGTVRKSSDSHAFDVLLSKPLLAGETLDLRIVGTLDLPSDQHLEIPDIRLVDTNVRQRYILLPRKLGEKSIAWKPQGMKHKTLPKPLKNLLDKSEDKLPFRVMSDRFSVRERSRENLLRQAALRHVVVRGVVDSDGTWAGTAEMVLQPGMATHCKLQLPQDSKLVQLWASGQPVRRERIESASDGQPQWRIPLGPKYLPQRITVSYIAQSSINGSRVSFVPPQILIGDQALPTPPTCWQLRTVGGVQFGESLIGRPIGSEAFYRLSLRACQKSLNDASSLALQLPSQESRPWFLAWQSYLKRISARLHTVENSRSRESLKAETLLRDGPLEERFHKAWALLAEQLAVDLTSSEYGAAAPPELPAWPTPALTYREVFMQSDVAGQILLRWRPQNNRGIWQMLLAVVVFCSGIALSRRLKRGPTWSDLLCRQPQATAIFVGLFWWLLLRPSLLGLLIAAVAALDWLRRWVLSRRESRRENPEDLSGASTSLAKGAT